MIENKPSSKENLVFTYVLIIFAVAATIYINQLWDFTILSYFSGSLWGIGARYICFLGMLLCSIVGRGNPLYHFIWLPTSFFIIRFFVTWVSYSTPGGSFTIFHIVPFLGLAVFIISLVLIFLFFKKWPKKNLWSKRLWFVSILIVIFFPFIIGCASLFIYKLNNEVEILFVVKDQDGSALEDVSINAFDNKLGTQTDRNGMGILGYDKNKHSSIYITKKRYIPIEISFSPYSCSYSNSPSNPPLTNILYAKHGGSWFSESQLKVRPIFEINFPRYDKVALSVILSEDNPIVSNYSLEPMGNIISSSLKYPLNVQTKILNNDEDFEAQNLIQTLREKSRLWTCKKEGKEELILDLSHFPYTNDKIAKILNQVKDANELILSFHDLQASQVDLSILTTLPSLKRLTILSSDEQLRDVEENMHFFDKLIETKPDIYIIIKAGRMSTDLKNLKRQQQFQKNNHK